jgi:hypothetical protein
MFGDLSQKSIVELKDTLQKLWRVKEKCNKQIGFTDDPMKEVELEDKIEECSKLIGECNQYIQKHKVEIIDSLLHKFNFKTQKAAFDEFWRRKDGRGIGTFLIHGEEYSGQNWIYQRLLDRVNVKTQKIFIEPKKCRRPYGIVGLIEVLSSGLNLGLGFLPPNPSIEVVQERCNQIIQILIAKLQKSSIVICLNGTIDFLSDNTKIQHFKEHNHLKLFVDMFWKELSNLISKHHIENKFVLFIIEEKIYAEDFPFFSNEAIESIKEHLPFQLPPIEMVSETYIHDWTKHHVFDSEHIEIFNPIHEFQDLSVCKKCLEDNQFLSPIDFFHHIHQVCNGSIPYERYY